MTDQSQTKPTRQWYEEYYRTHGSSRNDILRNRGTLFQILAYDVSVISALRSLPRDPRQLRVLDAGCGDGRNTMSLLRLGFEPSNITGVDILEERISEARSRLPTVQWVCGDASALDFSSDAFDLVVESWLFIAITDTTLAFRIASELLRVTKPGGHILLMDWRYSRPGSSKYRGLSRARIAEAFAVGRKTEVKGVHKGSLIPPVGRLISTYIPSLYFPLRAIAPLLVGQVATVLQKKG